MIKKLNEIHSGYFLNGNIINNLCYADDTALFSPSLRGLQLLISCCEEFSNHNHITFNIDKSFILPIYFDKSYHNPVKLYIDNKLLKVVKSYRYHLDILDIGFQGTYLIILIYIYSNIKHLYKQSYAISYNFNNCSKDTQIILFKTFVSNIYLSSIWIPNRYCMAKLNIAYNNAYHIVMNYRRRNSAYLICLNDYVNNLTVR